MSKADKAMEYLSSQIGFGCANGFPLGLALKGFLFDESL